MFTPFPTNYVWSLSANIALNTGGNAAEVIEICRSLTAAAEQDDGDQYLAAWSGKADDLVERARSAQAAGHLFTAGDLLVRASVYYLTAERMQAPHAAGRMDLYRRGLGVFHEGVELAALPCERVEIPYGDTTLPAYFVPADSPDGPAPTMVAYNGLDSTKEMVFGSGIAQQLARRGISTLIVDHPGSGEALRLRDLTGRHDSEQWSGPVVDYLETRTDVDSSRIGVFAWSLGGYYAPRAAAFEKRFRLCVAWGANYDWGEVQKRRLAREGDRPVPHYWNHVQWVFGKASRDEFMEFAPSMSLAGVVELITVPILIAHGANDVQIPMEYAQQQYDHATHSSDRELKVFTAEEGGAMHCSADNMAVSTSFISDWVSDRL